MMKIRFLYSIASICLLWVSINCKNDADKKPIEKQLPKKETLKPALKPKEEEVKSADSINHKNAIDFLIAYGERNKATKVLIKTRLGNITVKLYEDTPLHRANFIFLTEFDYFDTTCFHRVVPGFIIQGGNSESPKTLRIRNKYQNYTVPPEFRKHRKHKYGALAGARDWDVNISKKSNPFEFYIIQSKQGAHHLDGDHTVFGQVISGFNVIDKIANLEAGRDEWPYEDVFMDMEVID